MYTNTLTSHNIAISMSDKGKAWQNGYAARFMLTIKEEEVYLNEYQDYNDALANIGPFIDAVYNKKRIHSALGYIPPAQFEKIWNAQNPSVNSPKFLSWLWSKILQPKGRTSPVALNPGIIAPRLASSSSRAIVIIP